MKLKVGIFVLASFATIAANAQTWEKQIGPGVVYRMQVDASVPRIIHAVRYSLGAPGLTLKSELAGGSVFEENATKGRETISEMAARTGAILTVNGDFFPFTGDPLGVMVRDGNLLSTPSRKRAVFAWGSKAVGMGLIDFKGTAEFSGQKVDLKGINEECGLNDIVLHTDAASFAIGKTPNVHAVIRMDNPTWSPTGTVVGTFQHLFADTPKLPIQPGNAILTATGNKADLLKSMIPGEKVTIQFTSSGLDWSRFDQTMGGGPFLVKNGHVFVDAAEQGFDDAFTNKRHPRTAMGSTADGDIWIVVVDGRQKISDGATLPEMAKIMLDLGCRDAANLDGGGSSTFNLFGITLNRPSDGKERPVANGLALFGARLERSLEEIKIGAPASIELGSSKTLTVVGSDGKAIPNSEILWSSSGDGWIDQGGLLRPLQTGSVAVTAYVRGQLLRSTVGILEQPKKPVAEKAVAKSDKKSVSRGKSGRG